MCSEDVLISSCSENPEITEFKTMVEQTDICHQELGIKRYSEYSSENFKISVSNLPKSLNKYHAAKSLIEKHFKIFNYKKIKLGKTIIYVTFSSEEDRIKAIEIINNSEWKGHILDAVIAEAKEDPFIKKQRVADNKKSGYDQESDVTNIDFEPIDINSQVCPLFDRDYNIQIKMKTRTMKSILTMYKQIKRLNNNLARYAPQLNDWNEKNRAISCDFAGVELSPVLVGYRNKCEFNVDRDGNVGFRLGRYRDGSSRVVHPPSDCPILNTKMFQIIEVFERYLKDLSCTKLRGFDPVTHTGHVRQLTVRTNQNLNSLLIIDMDPNQLSAEEIHEEIQKMLDCFKEIEGIVSIYTNVSKKAHLTGMDQSLKLIYGQSNLVECMTIRPDLQLKFHIGPMSFFQVNTKCAEILYRSICDIGNLDKKTIVLDIGCGIGTISLSVAHKVHHVIGIEIIESAVADAKLNSRENGITNVSFYAGRAEDMIGEILLIAKDKLIQELNNEGSIVAILDPPRAGFNTSFVKTIRASQISKIVYVACDPKLNENLLSLCRPKSKAYQGEPFVPVKANAVDLFPHTKACELVILYQRLDQVI